MPMKQLFSLIHHTQIEISKNNNNNNTQNNIDASRIRPVHWKNKILVKAHFNLKHQVPFCTFQSCPFRNKGSRGCLSLNWQGRWPASLTPAHAVLGVAEQGWTGWKQPIKDQLVNECPDPRPGPP